MLPWLIFKNYLLSRRSGALVRIIAWHCILGIGMGVAALVIVQSVMNGFNITIRTRMLSVEPHLIVMQQKRPTDEDMERLRSSLRKIAPFEEVEVYESQEFIIRSLEGTFNGALAKGFTPSALELMLKRIWRGGTEIPRLEANEIILGGDLAHSMGVFEGDEVILVPPETLLLPKGEIPKFKKYRVRALLNTQMPEVDSKLMYYSIGANSQMLKSASLQNGFEIRLVDPYIADRAKAALVREGYNVQTWMERDSSLFFALKAESFIMTLFLSLAVLITSFSIVIVMVLLLSQKRQDIGLFMSMGLSYKRTRTVFLRVGLLLSFFGIFGGVLLGTAVCLILERHPLELLPDVYTDSTLPAKLTPRILGFVLLCSSLIAIFGSWLPVWRYISRDPSANLRKPAGGNV